ncbi:hypothetical protein FXO38_25521 [Capsicum annuum]|nr:hypothetical protein FXO38_25521 [Capsicum annuum]
MTYRSVISKPDGIWCYRCRTCREVFLSSQKLAAHTRAHISKGTGVKGLSHHKFFCPSSYLPDLYHYLEKFQLTVTFLPGRRCYNSPSPRDPMVQGSGHPRSVFDQSQQAMMLQVPRVATPTPTPVTPMLAQAASFAYPLNPMVSYQFNQNVVLAARPEEPSKSSIGSTSIAVQEEIDLELRL